MLAIGIISDDHVRAVRQGAVDPGLKCGTLSEVDRMSDHDRPTPECYVPRRVTGSIVDDQNAIATMEHVGKHSA